MQLELTPEIVHRLLKIAETGMGYQVVDLILTDGRILPNVTVFNAEIANLPEEFRGVQSSDVMDVRPSHSRLLRR